jgi:adenine-specific DNA-methyltransferase
MGCDLTRGTLMATSFEKLQALLSELFQLDQADLDFGIYRIMNQKRDEITRFLNKELLPQVKTAFAQYHPADKKLLEEKLEQARQAARTAGFEPEQSPKVKEIQEQLAAFSVDTDALENEVYSHLYSFFRRYYDAGDFISMRRYKEGVYAIPYEGEEVKLHWANADQYYIKTAEYFRDYAFKLPSGRTAHFKITEADVEKDNVKAAEEKDRRFILAGENAVQVQANEIIIRFEYRVDSEKRKQDAINTATIAAVLADPASADWVADLNGLAPSESNPRRTVLEKHLSDYTARNTFDYFIHKNLRGFLRRELDFYIKNEVMRLDDIENENAPRVEQYLSKVKALRSIAHKIIEFLAQIEDFQKKLYLKKKFVVETNYCITLDRVPEELYPEIAANNAQREEWVRLFAIDEIQQDLLKPSFTSPLTVEFLKANQFLLVDTKFFNEQFKSKILESVENIDHSLDGILIHSENFQALNLIQARYSQQINCVYIDPPYNTAASEILYRNNYKHSSWLTLLDNRFKFAHQLMSQDAIICVAIDDFEYSPLNIILNENYGEENHLSTIAVRSNPHGRAMAAGFSQNHEYALFYGKTDKAIVGRLPRDEKKQARYPGLDDKGSFTWMNFRATGANSRRIDRPKLFYPVFVSEDGSIRVPTMEWNQINSKWEPTEKPSQNEVVVLPIDTDGNERVWNLGWERAQGDANNELNAKVSDERWQIYRKYRPNEEGALPNTWWDDAKYSATESGTRILKDLFGEREGFSYPKSIYLVEDSLRAANCSSDALTLDYFAGSGTTAHAVINLNRVDDSNRKYICVEMGEYFNVVTKPRVEKVIYSKDWKDGKPISRLGSSHCFKYMRLESYEDVLNNLDFKRNETQQLALEQSTAFREKYLLSYMLDTESQQSLLNIETFVHPFDYKLNIATGEVGESKPRSIDLVETFNYLIGLRVKTMQTIRGYKVITGLTPEGERALIIWRDLTEKSNADLEEFFRKQDYNPRDMEFDLIFVNGDNNLENLRRPDETWKVRLIEDEFMRRMFDTEGL